MKIQPFWKTRHSTFDIKLFYAGFIIIAHELCILSVSVHYLFSALLSIDSSMQTTKDMLALVIEMPLCMLSHFTNGSILI